MNYKLFSLSANWTAECLWLFSSERIIQTLAHRVLSISFEWLRITRTKSYINFVGDGCIVSSFNLTEIRGPHVLPRTWSHVFHPLPKLVSNLWSKQVMSAIASWPKFALWTFSVTLFTFITVLSASHRSKLAHAMTSWLIIRVWCVDFHRFTQSKFPNRVVETLSEAFMCDVSIDFISSWTAIGLCHALFFHVCNCVLTILFWGINNRHFCF